MDHGRTTQLINERQILTLKEKAGRFNLLLAIILTVVNIALSLGGEEMVITGCVIAAVMLIVCFLCCIGRDHHDH